MRIAAWLLAALLLAAASARADDRIDLQYQGSLRDYLLHVPPNAGSESLPLVIALHGAGGDAASFAGETRFAQAADKLGMLVAFPDGSEGGNPPRRTFNAQICCGDAVTRQVDDVGFVGSVIEDIAQHHPVDRARIFATGMSNGGMLTYQLAAMHPEWFAAVAPVSAAIGGMTRDGRTYIIPMPKLPVAVMIIHGRKDPYVLYEGGSSRMLSFPHIWKMSVGDALSFWAASDGCAGPPAIGHPRGPNLERVAYANCKDGSEVVLWEIMGGDHNWPGDIFPAPGGGKPVSAAEAILAFFATHRQR
jgi:polyhydroxybutyrate depolymerase